MNKIFYDPRRDNKIIGMSDGPIVMDFPYLETEKNYHSLANLYIKKAEDGELSLASKKSTLEKTK